MPCQKKERASARAASPNADWKRGAKPSQQFSISKLPRERLSADNRKKGALWGAQALLPPYDCDATAFGGMAAASATRGFDRDFLRARFAGVFAAAFSVRAADP